MDTNFGINSQFTCPTGRGEGVHMGPEEHQIQQANFFSSISEACEWTRLQSENRCFITV